MSDSVKYRMIELLGSDLSSFHSISDIAKKLKIAYSHAHLFIQRLTKENIITIKKVGNASVCILNTKEPLTLSLLAQISYKKTAEYRKTHPQSSRIFEKIPLIEDSVHSIIMCANKIIIITPEKISNTDFSLFKNRSVINQYQLLSNKEYYKDCIILHGAEKYWNLITK